MNQYLENLKKEKEKLKIQKEEAEVLVKDYNTQLLDIMNTGSFCPILQRKEAQVKRVAELTKDIKKIAGSIIEFNE